MSTLPESGWGYLVLEKSRPEVNRRWTDTGQAHDERTLKHRPARRPGAFRYHPNSDRGHVIASTAISDVWAEPARSLSSPTRSPHHWQAALQAA